MQVASCSTLITCFPVVRVCLLSRWNVTQLDSFLFLRSLSLAVISTHCAANVTDGYWHGPTACPALRQGEAAGLT